MNNACERMVKEVVMT